MSKKIVLNLTRDDLVDGIAHRLEHQSERRVRISTILTEAQLARIPSLVKQGRSAAEIADELGCSIGTLRVRCSQFGIILRWRPARGREKIVAAMDLVPAVAKPPPLAEFLLGVCIPSKRSAYVLGCMNERFDRDCERYGIRRAKRLYWSQVLRSVGPLAIRTLGHALKWGALAEAFRRKFLG
jgi:hypothetical protein